MRLLFLQGMIDPTLTARTVKRLESHHLYSEQKKGKFESQYCYLLEITNNLNAVSYTHLTLPTICSV